jgi:hypothetical protein
MPKIRRLGVWNTPGLWHKDRKYPYVRLSRKPRLVGRNKASQGEWTHPKYAVRDRRVQEEEKTKTQCSVVHRVSYTTFMPEVSSALNFQHVESIAKHLR